MPRIQFNKHDIECRPGESVLDALIRHNIDAPYSCRTGICQTCMMRSTQGNVPPDSQHALKLNLRKQGYFLACQCKPDGDMEVQLPESEKLFVNAELIEKQALSPTVYRLRLQTATPLYYHAGQFLNLKRSDGLMRSYSLASLPSEDDWLELHVKRMDNGLMSNWLADEFNVGDSIEIEGPIGDCFYAGEMQQQPLLLVGSGTGLAPLIGVVRDALHHRHDAPIHIYHGAFSQQELYLDQQLKQLAEQHEQLHYQSCITGEMPEETVLQGHACDIALTNHPHLSGWQVYVCGAPAMVKSMQQRAYLAGASMQDIHIDPFETRDLRQQSR